MFDPDLSNIVHLECGLLGWEYYILEEVITHNEIVFDFFFLIKAKQCLSLVEPFML